MIKITITKDKIKKFWNQYQYEIVSGAVIVSSIATMVYIFKRVSSAPITRAVLDNGPTIDVALGGVQSPVRFKATREAIDGYNRAASAVHKAIPLPGGTYAIDTDRKAMQFYNAVADITNAFIAENGPINADLIPGDYLVIL